MYERDIGGMCAEWLGSILMKRSFKALILGLFRDLGDDHIVGDVGVEPRTDASRGW